MSTRIVVVDDHPVFRQGLAALMSTDPELEEVGEAADPEEALRVIDETGPDLVILDLFLRSRLSLDLIGQIAERWPALPVLVLSMYDEEVYASRVLSAGAMGYVMKEEAAETLLQAIRTVLGGGIHLSPAAAQRVLNTVAGRAEAVSLVDHLTDRELEVFRLIGKGRDTKAIAKTLGISTKTVESYRAQLKTKLGARNVYDLVRLAAVWIATDPLEADPGTGA